MSVLLSIRASADAKSSLRASPGIKVAFALLLILLTASSRNFAFVAVVGAAVMVRMCFLPEKTLTEVASLIFKAVLFPALVLLPAVFMGNRGTLVAIVSKVALSAAVTGIISHTMKWNEITGGLRFFRIPDICILTLDLTLKYIVLLGEICADVLTALTLRSVGRICSRRKKRALSGVLGTTLIKSVEMSEETYEAMTCRCFNGKYSKYGKTEHSAADFFLIACAAAAALIFIVMERAMSA